jgi:CheY-like chemotaxis protein
MTDRPQGLDHDQMKPRSVRFQHLMRFRVRHILLVSSLYDSFILTEDGQLNEALLRQYINLNLSENPVVTRVSNGSEALAMAEKQQRFDLILTSMHVGDMDAEELAQRAKAAGLDIPVVLLAFNNRELTDFVAVRKIEALDRIFLWQGDVRILLAIVKYVEDRLNVRHDSGMHGVPIIIVVEDNVRFYSSFLPVIYSELVNHSHGLIMEGLNLSQKMMRFRARPKVLLCTSYEEAWRYFSEYEEHVLGVISDIEFPRRGKLDRRAGVELTSRIQQVRPDIPIVLQSSLPENEELAKEVGAAFLLKGSPVLLHQLETVLKENFGFGDFVFRTADGAEVDRAHDLMTLIEKLRTVPAECLAYHGERNHFSNWLKARTEFTLAQVLRPRKVSDFTDLEHLRQDLIKGISRYRRERDEVIVADFTRDKYEPLVKVSRIGGGSLGGKARGLAFVNRLINDSDLEEKFPGVRVSVPSCVVLGTDIFDEFLESNGLKDFAIDASDDTEIVNRFLAMPFPEQAVADLAAFLEKADYPLAVRSSGLLEDSPNQPFAGVYQTYMLPNNDPDPARRLVQLIAAVKLVYASTFRKQAKSFLRMTSYRLEEEKMGVIIQRIVGAAHENRFYPDFSGVARSHNFYPTAPLKAEDGIVAAALGFGRTVVEGGACLRFCPKYPQHVISFSSVDDVVRNSQREFYGLDIEMEPRQSIEEGDELRRYGLQVAEQDGTLSYLGSTYSPENKAVYDGLSRAGIRLISFAPILKHGLFPMAELLDELLKIGVEGTSAPVEIEFAVNLSVPKGEPIEFGYLQMRPLALSRELEELTIGDVPDASLVCRSDSVLGNGKVEGLRDLVVVDYHRFERSKSVEVAELVARFNAHLQSDGIAYVLIGVGRWGSTDPFLGIPVAWGQIAGARVIVEAGFKDFKVSPSQGTHFFQNLTSCNVGYFTVNPEAGEGSIDWEWLGAQQAVAEDACVRHIRLEEPLLVKMSGRKGEGIILKPGAEE